MTKNKIISMTIIVALVIFAMAVFSYNRNNENTVVRPQAVGNQLIRSHSPILGPENAAVTIVEFFDPACEACRAFYPIVHKIKNSFPGSVRVVLRYAALHKDSDQAVRILETARIQKKFVPVLEALLEAQPAWASHHAPDISKAWKTAADAGLNIEQAKADMMNSKITAVLTQDMADMRAMGVRRTPTFFVNGKPLTSFGAQQLYDLVRQEVEKSNNK